MVISPESHISCLPIGALSLLHNYCETPKRSLETIVADVVSIPKTNENFRLLYDTKGRFRLHSIRDEEAKVHSKLFSNNMVLNSSLLKFV